MKERIEEISKLIGIDLNNAFNGHKIVCRVYTNVASQQIRIRMSKCVKKQKYGKALEAVLGCDYETFKKHIESKFTDGMSWENYGKWHFDHNEPTSRINSMDSFLKILNYQNIQPLWAKDNLKKGNKNNKEWRGEE